MDRARNYSDTYKVDVEFDLKVRWQGKYLIYEVKFTLCDTIYIGNTKRNIKKIMDSNLSDAQQFLKTGQKLDS